LGITNEKGETKQIKILIIENQWKDIPKEIKIRFQNAINSVYFFGFIFMLLTLGALGVWVPPYRFEDTTLLNSESLFTYSGPILAMLLVEYFVQASRSKLAVIALILGIIAFSLLTIGYVEEPSEKSSFTIIGTILTLLLIIFVNANNAKFNDNEEGSSSDDINSSIGGTNATINTIINAKKGD